MGESLAIETQNRLRIWNLMTPELSTNPGAHLAKHGIECGRGLKCRDTHLVEALPTKEAVLYAHSWVRPSESQHYSLPWHLYAISVIPGLRVDSFSEMSPFCSHSYAAIREATARPNLIGFHRVGHSPPNVWDCPTKTGLRSLYVMKLKAV